MSATSVPTPRRAASRQGTARRARPAAVPRRVSGPVTGRPRARVAPQHVPSVGARALAVVRSLPDRSLIDRLVRGRAWIPVLGILLVGIVLMQVEILKLGTSLGRSLERTASLQSQNETLQAGVASLSDPERIERLAMGMGMVQPSPELLTFLAPGSQGQLGRAIANIHAPDPADFSLQLSSQIAAADLAAPSSPTASSGATSSTGGQSTGAPGSAATSATSGTAQSSTSASGTSSGSLPQTGTSAPTGGTTTGSSGATGATGTDSTPTAPAAPVGGGGGAGLAASSTTQSGSSGGG